MNLRKFNSILSLVCIILLLIHAFLNVFYLFGLIPYSIFLNIFGIFIILLFLVHAVISLYQGAKNKRYIKTYPKIRKDSESQTISGVVSIILAFIHTILNIMGIGGYPLLIVDVIFFIVIGYHLQLSIPRLLVSMGFLTSDKSFNKASIISKVFVFIFIILTIISAMKLCIFL